MTERSATTPAAAPLERTPEWEAAPQRVTARRDLIAHTVSYVVVNGFWS